MINLFKIKPCYLLFSLYIISGCTTTTTDYPDELRLIIAQSRALPGGALPENEQPHLVQTFPRQSNRSSESQAISVSQLLQSVNSQHRAMTVDDQMSGMGQSIEKPQDYASYASLLSQMKKHRPTQSLAYGAMPKPHHQLELHYQDSHMLPHHSQLMLAKQMVNKQSMQIYKLVIGGSHTQDNFERVVTAQHRAKQLMAFFGVENVTAAEYQPAIGDNVVIVTLIPRGQ